MFDPIKKKKKKTHQNANGHLLIFNKQLASLLHFLVSFFPSPNDRKLPLTINESAGRL